MGGSRHRAHSEREPDEHPGLRQLQRRPGVVPLQTRGDGESARGSGQSRPAGIHSRLYRRQMPGRPPDEVRHAGLTSGDQKVFGRKRRKHY